MYELTQKFHKKYNTHFFLSRKQGHVSMQPKVILIKTSRKCFYFRILTFEGSPLAHDPDDPLSRHIRDIHNDTRKSTRIIRDSRARLLEIQKVIVTHLH